MFDSSKYYENLRTGGCYSKTVGHIIPRRASVSTYTSDGRLTGDFLTMHFDYESEPQGPKPRDFACSIVSGGLAGFTALFLWWFPGANVAVAALVGEE